MIPIFNSKEQNIFRKAPNPSITFSIYCLLKKRCHDNLTNTQKLHAAYIKKILKIGYDSYSKALIFLIQNNFIKVIKIRKKTGEFHGVFYKILDMNFLSKTKKIKHPLSDLGRNKGFYILYYILYNNIYNKNKKPIYIGKNCENINKNYFMSHLIKNKKFISKWKEWLNYRKEMKIKTSEYAIKLHANVLNKLSVSNAINSINNSINNSWRGIFPYPSYRSNKNDNRIKRSKNKKY